MPPPGPLDQVQICPGCASLVADMTLHTIACMGGGDAQAAAAGDVIVGWLDSLDPADLEKAAFAGAGFDDNPTSALLTELRRRAEALT